MTTEECKVEDLPSARNYEKFDGGEEGALDGTTDCNKDNVKAALDKTLGSYPNIKGDAHNIANAWCTIINGADGGTGAKKKVEGVVYDLFYFWLGEKVWKEVNGGSESFKDIMEKIYQALKEKFPDSKYTYVPICTDNIEQNKFNKLKKADEYYLDYEQIKDISDETDPDGTPPCNCECKQHLEQTASSYIEVYEKCSSQADDDYCPKFREMFEGYTEDKPLDTKCKMECAEKLIADIDSFTRSNSSGTGATPIISSVFSIAGIGTVVPFFLYKVIVATKKYE